VVVQDRLKKLINELNKKGVPLPTVRDPKTGVGSVSLTLVILSSIYVQIALLNSFANIFEGVNFDGALYWFMSCASLYFVRKYQKGKDGVLLDVKDDKEE